MGTPKPSSVRQGTPTSNQHHHEGFHLPLPCGRRHGRGRPPVPLQQLLQLLPLHLRLWWRLQPLHLWQLLWPPLLQAQAEAEADPALLYSTGVHGVHYPMTYGIHNYGYSHAYPYTYGYTHHMGKREAEADPALVYTSGLTHYPMTYGIHNYGYAAHYPYTYGLHNYGYTHYPYTTAYSHIFKREAEAEPQYGYYGNYYSRPYGYSRTYGYSSYRPYSYGRFGYRGYY